MFADVCRDAGTARVKRVDKKPRTRRRPVAMDTIEMEILAVRKLRFSARDTMNIAERLYTQVWGICILVSL